ncbi:MAG: HD-GYP domain-containing protein [Phycisphaerae bacterium]|nr:HD-GYP domain-containing protein [Phycisphaerae bacterium]
MQGTYQETSDSSAASAALTLLNEVCERGAELGLTWNDCISTDGADGVHTRCATDSAGAVPRQFSIHWQGLERRTVHHCDEREAELITTALRWSLEKIAGDQEHELVVADFCEKLSQAYEETYSLFRAMRMLATSDNAESLIQSVCADIQSTLPFDWLAVQFSASSRVVGSLRGKLVLVGKTPVPPEALAELAFSRVATVKGDSWTKVLDPARDVFAESLGSEVVVEPITHDDTVIGVLLAGGKHGSDPEVASPEIQFLDAAADFLGTFHENIARLDEQREMMLGTLHALVAAIDAKDRYTCGHSERVAAIAAMIAESMGMGEREVERVRLSGLVHDVGKIGVPEAILCKPGRLTEEEFAAIQRHPTIGHCILQGVLGFTDLLPGVLHHHERWDGKGYPHKLAGEAIPLMARIIGLADAFDAMSSTRSYRSALPRERVLEEIRKGAGSQFDPRVVNAFQRVNLAAYEALLARHAGASDWIDPIRAAA